MERWIQTCIKQPVTSREGRQKAGMLAGVVGITLNIFLFALKLIAGLLTASIAILADAFNNLSDAGSSLVTLVGFRLAGQPADLEHPFGHGRIEYLAGFVVSMLIMLMGAELLKGSVGRIFQGQPSDVSVLAVCILLVSIAVKAGMALFQRRLGKMMQSATIQATSMDSLNDMAATAAVLLGTVLEKAAGVVLDGYFGVLVALFILYTGLRTAKDTIEPLLGKTPDPSFVKGIEDTVLAHGDIIDVHDLIVHDYGPTRVMISLHAEVSSKQDVIKMHDTIDVIERELKEKYLCDAVIHMDPVVTDDQKVTETAGRVKKIVFSVHPALSLHDFRMVEGPTHTNLIFDLVIPFNLEIKDRQVVQSVQKEIVAQLGQSYFAVISVDKPVV